MKKFIITPKEHTFCDMCGRDITAGTVYGFTAPDGSHWDVCAYFPDTNYKYRWQMPKYMRTLQSCEEEAKMLIGLSKRRT